MAMQLNVRSVVIRNPQGIAGRFFQTSEEERKQICISSNNRDRIFFSDVFYKSITTQNQNLSKIVKEKKIREQYL
jgi:hypothetical protein